MILNHIEVVSKTPYDSNENFYCLFTLCGGPMCAMFFTSDGWDLRNIAKSDQESVNCELFQFFQRLSTRFKRNFLQLFYTLWGTYVCNEINIVRLGFKKQPKLTKKHPFLNFFNFFKNCRNDSNETFSSYLALCGGPMCAMRSTS